MPRVRMMAVCSTIVAAFGLVVAMPAMATIVVVEDYTFNDNATPSGFTAYGTPTYSNGSLVLDGASAITATTPLTALDNFGIETVVTAATLPSDNTFVVWNGDTALQGGCGTLQFYSQTGTTWGGLLNQVASVGNGADAVVQNAKTYLALVRNAGTTTFYVNGAVAGSLASSIADAVPTHLTIGALRNGAACQNYFTGSVDEVRLFTFTAGQFNSGDLLTAVPEPTTLTCVVTGLFGLLAYAWRKRK